MEARGGKAGCVRGRGWGGVGDAALASEGVRLLEGTVWA